VLTDWIGYVLIGLLGFSTGQFSLLMKPFLIVLLGLLLPAPTTAGPDCSCPTGNPCFSFERTSGRPGSRNFEVRTEREGKPLNQKQKDAVQDAIDMLKNLEKCMSKPIPLDGSNGEQSLTKDLQGLLDGGNICQETVEVPGKAASASRDGDGFSNHPGVNISGKYMDTDDGAGGTDNIATLQLAEILIHESSHLNNPNDGANNAEEFETTAVSYEASTLCSILSSGCLKSIAKNADEYEDMNEQICDQIKLCNKILCDAGAPQVDCACCCADLIAPGPCPPDNFIRANGATGPNWHRSVVPVALAGGGRGHVILTPWQRTLNYNLHVNGEQRRVEVDLSILNNESVIPLSLLRAGDSSWQIGVAREADFVGTVWQIDFDLSSPTLNHTITQLTSSGSMKWPVALTGISAAPNTMFAIDGIDDAIHHISLKTGKVKFVADPSYIPELAGVKEIATFESTFSWDAGSSWVPSYTVAASSDPFYRACIPPSFSTVVGLVDTNLDTILDDYVIWN